jgi:tripartite-type tricarboxylate transporter receptor subunit TctC
MRICFILVSILALAFANAEAWAQAWPTKPIRAVVAFSGDGSFLDEHLIEQAVTDPLKEEGT